jgi:hypothetical protein
MLANRMIVTARARLPQARLATLPATASEHIAINDMRRLQSATPVRKIGIRHLEGM